MTVFCKSVIKYCAYIKCLAGWKIFAYFAIRKTVSGDRIPKGWDRKTMTT